MPQRFRRPGLIMAAILALGLAPVQGYAAQAAVARGHPSLPAAMPKAATRPVASPARPDAGGGDGCNPNRTNDFLTYRWDGWRRFPDTTVGGVYSDIYNYSPWVHYISANESDVSAWTALGLTTNSGDYAQVGWLEYPHGLRYVFTETSTNGNFFDNFYNPEPINSNNYYTTLYNNTPGYFTYQVKGTTIDTEKANFAPNYSIVSGETHSLADQMPGGYNQNEYFSDTHIYYSGGWHNFSGSAYNSSSDYGYSIPSSTQMLIWDKACAN